MRKMQARRGDGTLEKAVVDLRRYYAAVSAAAEGLEARGARAETPRPVADASPARATIETADDAGDGWHVCARMKWSKGFGEIEL